MSETYRKDYIKSVYQPFSKFQDLQNKQNIKENFATQSVPGIVKNHGLYWSQSPSPYGPPTQSLDRAEFDYIFQDLYNRN